MCFVSSFSKEGSFPESKSWWEPHMWRPETNVHRPRPVLAARARADAILCDGRVPTLFLTPVPFSTAWWRPKEEPNILVIYWQGHVVLSWKPRFLLRAPVPLQRRVQGGAEGRVETRACGRRLPGQLSSRVPPPRPPVWTWNQLLALVSYAVTPSGWEFHPRVMEILGSKQELRAVDGPGSGSASHR